MSTNSDNKTSLTHFDSNGCARMVNVSEKTETHRVAVATAQVMMQPETAALIIAGQVAKGDVLAVARLAGIAGMKRSADLIPLCHPLRISGVDLHLEVQQEPYSHIVIKAEVHAVDRTGVEMEALTAVSVAALTVYDMCKAVDRGMSITEIQLEEKIGGKSGHWKRK